MKRRDKRPLTIGQPSDLRLQASAFRLSATAFLSAFVMLVDQAFALTDANPYGGIIGRNAFALKPPTPVSTTPITPVVLPATIELQGITTILGRPQVLLKLKLPAKPPEPAKDQSVVLDIGQREGEVEVLDIDSAAGVVRLKNRGEDLSLNMQDNAAKPQVVAGLPTPIPGASVISQPSINPGLPSPSPQSGVTLPTRQLRSDNTGATMGAGGTTPATAQQQQLSGRSVEANVAAYEATRAKNEELIKSGVKLPRMPQHPLLRRVATESTPPE